MTKEKKGTRHVLLVVDQSGSMGLLADDVRGGFNTYLETLAADADTADVRLTVMLFATTHALLCPAGSKLAAVPQLDRDNYRPGGMTALYDAIGNIIIGFETDTKLGKHDRVLMVVQTDGRENSSHEFSAELITKMIADRKKGGKWTTAFLGAGPEAWDAGAAVGAQTVNTTADQAGTRSTYVALAAATRSYSAGESEAVTLGKLEQAASSGPDS